jgi:hypothetical protein
MQLITRHVAVLGRRGRSLMMRLLVQREENLPSKSEQYDRGIANAHTSGMAAIRALSGSKWEQLRRLRATSASALPTGRGETSHAVAHPALLESSARCGRSVFTTSYKRLGYGLALGDFCTVRTGLHHGGVSADNLIGV